LIRGLSDLLIPDLAGGVDAAERPGHIRKASRILVGALAAKQPLLIWVDALQWADGPSLELFGALSSSTDQVPLLAVFSSRPDPRTEGVLSGLPHIEVGELHDAERRRLIKGRFDGAQVPNEVAQSIVERAGGNPFFVIELVEALVDRGVVRIEGEGNERRVVRKPGVPIALPTTLEGVIAARLDELPESERRAIRWLAAAGAGINSDALSEMAGADLSEPLSALESRGFVARGQGDTYNFPSAVVRHVAYETTDESDREAMHAEIGTWLSEQKVPAPPARIARHLERAGNPAAAADAYLQAAARARAVYSNREALRFFARALSLLPADAPGRFYAHEAREQILRGMGSPREQQLELEEMRECAKRSNDPAMMAMAMNRSARFELDHARTLGVADYLEEALRNATEADDKGGEVEALRLSAVLARENGNADEALDFCDRALVRCGLDRALLAARGSVLVQKAEILRRLGRVHAAVETNAEAIVIFRRLAIRRNESMALNGLGIALASQGEFEDAAVVIRASIGVDREIGDRMHLGRKLSNVGQLNAELGEVEIALEFLERADEVLSVIHDDSARADALAATAELVLEFLGEPDQAAEKLDHARRIAERTADRYDMARERIVRAALEVAMGRMEQAEDAAREAVEISRSANIIVYQLLAQARLAEILATRGKEDEARDTISSVREAALARGPIERGERVHLALARALECLSATDDARSAYGDAYKVVELRLSQIRSPRIRERYLQTPVVKAIRDAL
jgi:tetratricopeptide (TPR) repeat protein